MNRNASIDIMKLVASFGVISLHVPSSTYAAGIFNLIFWPICVPFFYVVSLTYFVSGLKGSTLTEVFMKSWKRIIIPYIAWTVIYVGMLWLKSILVGGHRSFEFWRIVLYGESSMHLYYIPTLLCMQAIALAVFLFISGSQKNKIIGALILSVSIVYLIIGDVYDCFGVATTGQVVGMAAYIACAFIIAPTIKRNHFNLPLALAAILVLSIVIISNFLNVYYMFLGYTLLFPMGGIALFLLVYSVPVHYIPNWLLYVSTASYGIYLSHVAFLEAFQFIIEKIYPGDFVYDFGIKLAVISIIFMGSIIFTYLARQIPFARQLLLGEK